ncbi:hypothetical protein F4780DRAFT_250569 [Xylariomycetidae sp. FL0641]|nr:hypothetical protein F4780DRAFT_250569 [Xylariomycetidae sp. FL0641]
MPLLPAKPLARAEPDSWPMSSPTRCPPSLDDDCMSTDEEESDIPLAHENPLTYFLTPPTPQKDDDLEFDFNFDAGIEDSSHPREIVRSISPSTLDGLKRYKPKSKGRDCAILDDDDDDDEDYIRFQPRKALPFGFEDYFDRPRHMSPASPTTSASPLAEASLSPTSFHVGSPRGRPAKRFAPPRRFRNRPSAHTLQRRHSWREPSPDVWSIEEEPERETMSEMGLSTDTVDDGTTQPIDIPAAKPKKKVRFVLPDEE